MILANKKKGIESLLFVYYSGHGACMGGLTCFLLDNEKMFPAESHLRIFAKKAFVMVLFDCCRENVEQSKWKTKGSGYDSMADIDCLLDNVQDDSKKKINQQNYIITYGCPPSGFVAAKSTIAISYFRQLRNSAGDQGSI